jgi:YesN/AraC family two-component response regulator
MTEIREHIRRSGRGTVWLCQTKPDLLACIVQDGGASPSLTPERAADLTRHILQQYSSYFKATVAVGTTVGDIGDLHLSYASAVVLLQHKSLHPRTETFYAGDSFDLEQQIDCFITVDETNLILNVFKSRRYDKLLAHACEWIDKAMRRQFSAHQVKNLCSDILNAWIRAVETERNELNVSYYIDWFNRLNRCVTWEELKTCFDHIHRQLFRAEWTSEPNAQMSSIVDYIHSHYGEELTLDQLAERLNMSISHFSRTFKEEVGEKYVEYIAKYRISMAKRMLQETDLKIDEIAEKVGYMGRNSFIRMFRKYEGITPGQYRLIYPK